MFIGRARELSELERLYRSDHFEMPVIYGRRRTGKTRLITTFIAGKRAIYVQARRSNAAANLRLLSQAILGFATGTSTGSFSSFDEALDALAALARDERLVFVIDEFPYLAQSFPEISSLLQEKIDHAFKNESKMMLILCGSSLSFMEEQVLGYESPLYGRRTAQFKILPLPYREARTFWAETDPVDAATYYGITGGIPAYLELIDPTISVRKNIERLFLTPSGFLFEEPTNLLLQECRNPDQYDAIIQAIAAGRSRLSEIASLTGIPESNTRTYLVKLQTLGIVKRELPFGVASSKRAIYALADHMFRFWYRIVPSNLALIQNGMANQAYARIEDLVPTHMGAVFEEICLQYLYNRARAGDLGIVPAKAGRWWGTDPRTRTQEEIDIIASDGDAALFAECKWRNEPADAEVLRTLVHRSELFPHAEKCYFVFSKTGFTAGCTELAQQRGDVELVTLADMYGD